MNIWKVILHHNDPESALERTVSSGHMAVGWGDIGDLRKLQPTDAKAITRRIRDVCSSPSNAGMGGPSLWNFFSNMREGDLVILVGSGRRHLVVEVDGPYFWSSRSDSFGDYQHQRRIVVTEENPDLLWTSCGKAVISGQNARWTVALCSEEHPNPGQDTRYSEGTRYDIFSRGIERNAAARAECIAHHGLKCAVCCFDFEKQYGDIGKGFIHVHHRKPLSGNEGAQNVDPVRDLVPLCPNCHAMAHRRRPPFSVAELQQMLRRR